jgi:hypothetical protein
LYILQHLVAQGFTWDHVNVRLCISSSRCGSSEQHSAVMQFMQQHGPFDAAELWRPAVMSGSVPLLRWMQQLPGVQFQDN